MTAVSVDSAGNTPGGNADLEVVLDIEVAGSVAPGAHIVVYFAPNTDRGFIDAVNAAVHDATNQPSVISISWGAPEEDWTDQMRRALDQAFVDASLLGVSVFAAAGDHGSADRPQFITDANGAQIRNPAYDGLAHVDFPSSSPHVVACGGTHLESSGGVPVESVWNDGDGWATGGGVSAAFGRPEWQGNVNVPPSVNGPGSPAGRGVPDVAGNADSTTGYRIFVNGADVVVGGTSAVAPLWAGLVALVNEAAGRHVGFVNMVLYAGLGSPAFRDTSVGSNAIAAQGGATATAGYGASSGWDACTGLGSPDGRRVSALLRGMLGTAHHLYTASAAERDQAVAQFGYRLEGVACHVYPEPDVGVSDHFYTTSAAERDNAIVEFGYHLEGTACYVDAVHQPGTTQLYRLVNGQNGDHFYTTSPAERDSAVANYGYRLEGVACYVYSAEQQGTTALYRLVRAGDHFYTSSPAERDSAVVSYGYRLEGVACYVYDAAQTGTAPFYRMAKPALVRAAFYRLSNSGTGDHLYTASPAERDSAVAHYGYRLEGVACYVHSAQQPAAIPFYRLAPARGDHFYTSSVAERDSVIAHNGYHLEGVAGYVYDAQRPTTTPFFRLVRASWA